MKSNVVAQRWLSPLNAGHTRQRLLGDRQIKIRQRIYLMENSLPISQATTCHFGYPHSLMKRSREAAELDATITNMANCLMQLSSGPYSNESYDSTTGRVFECKTCNRQFPSFQALGGHRASHKKPRIKNDGDLTHGTKLVPVKPKSHECSICGLEFSVGQALGGHMRRHRATTTNESQSFVPVDTSSSIVKKVNARRVFGLDLNLTPLENDLEFRLGMVVPTTMELCL
ncbi:hypothetical protein QVD17_28817 [Tagetes erecta]|uniref:C2H2-type domain-containing protein n=1 Tax=Tagetes erecta TaxID=13708 RepID=A0AAD8KHB7_TARER|nr:hypothetical protein QVD17_28817 [Tagetes erecta]